MTTAVANRRPGRPRKYGPGRINATVRFTPERYAGLQAEASKHGRSVSEQVEHEIEQADTLRRFGSKSGSLFEPLEDVMPVKARALFAELERERAIGPRRLLEPSKPFYLIYEYYGEDCQPPVDAVTDRDKAIELARKRAQNDPHVQYVIMRAEIIIRVEETAVEIKQIEL